MQSNLTKPLISLGIWEFNFTFSLASAVKYCLTHEYIASINVSDYLSGTHQEAGSWTQSIALHAGDQSVLPTGMETPFLTNNSSEFFTEQLGMQFLQSRHQFLDRENSGTLTQSLINLLRVVRMLGDFQQHGSILRRYYTHKELLTVDQY